MPDVKSFAGWIWELHEIIEGTLSMIEVDTVQIDLVPAGKPFGLDRVCIIVSHIAS
jgi:hypothetical protein